jgi:hypothetical protein
LHSRLQRSSRWFAIGEDGVIIVYLELQRK